MADTSTFVDPNSYTWSAPLDNGSIWAGATITVTAPGGESTNWCVNDVFQTAEDVYNRQGTFGYPVTSAEQAFIDQCNGMDGPLLDFMNQSTSVIVDAESALAWLHQAQDLAYRFWWVPVIGQIGAAMAFVTSIGDKSVVEPLLNDLIRVAQQAGNADVQLRDLANAVGQHSMTLADAQAHLGDVAQYAVSNFWQILLNMVSTLAH